MNFLMGGGHDPAIYGGQGSAFGQGFGQSGHGIGSGFGQSNHGSGSFGQSHGQFGQGHTSFAGTYHSPYGNHGRYQYGPNGFLQRRNSLLSDMTHSKHDKTPMFFSSFSQPQGDTDHDGLISSLYSKPLERKKPPLVRQSSVTVESAPRRKVLDRRASVSGPLIRQQSSLTEKRPPLRSSMSVASSSPSRKYSLSDRAPKDHSPFHRKEIPLGKQRSGEGKQHAREQGSSPRIQRSVMSPLAAGLMSRRAEVHRDAGSDTESSVISETESKPPTLDDQSALILSLLNPETSPPVEDPRGRSHSFGAPARHLQSPSEIRREPFKFLTPSENQKAKSHSPKSSRAPKTSRAPKVPQKKKKEKEKEEVNMTANPKRIKRSDSDSSEVFYDCDDSTSVAIRTSPNGKKQGKSGDKNPANQETKSVPAQLADSPGERNPVNVRKMVDQFNRNNSPQTKDDTALPEKQPTKRRPNLRDISAVASFRYMDPEDDSEEETMPLPQIKRASVKKPFFNISDIQESDEEEENVTELDLSRNTDHLDCPEPSHNGTFTADSSESGYATSARYQSPRESEIKSALFVNQLSSNHSDDEDRLTDIDDVMNGSGTESEPEVILKKGSIASFVECLTGSDTDDPAHETSWRDQDRDSNSTLEVMKLLDSPTAVRDRISSANAQNQRSSSRAVTSVCDKNDSKSEPVGNQPLHEHGANSNHPDHALKSNPRHVDAKCVVINDLSHNAEPGSPKPHKKTPKNSFKSFLERPLLSWRQQSFTNNNEDNVTGTLDCVLHIVNVVLFLLSGAVVGGGIWLLLKDFNVNQITEVFGSNLLQIIIYIAISGAAIASLVTLCLCCGVKQDRVGLGFYAFVLVLVVVAFTTAAILTSIFSDKLQGVELRFNFKDRLVSKYGKQDLKENTVFTTSWNTMQRTFSCCGAYGNINATTSWAIYKQTEWFRDGTNDDSNMVVYVPESCCVQDKNIAVCQEGDYKLFGPPLYGPPQRPHFKDINPHLNTDGCFEKVSDHLLWLLSIILIVLGSLAGLFFLVALLTWFFCFKVRNKREYDEDYSDYDETEDNDDVFELTEKPAHGSGRSKHDTYGFNPDSRGTRGAERLDDDVMDRRDRWYHSDTHNNHLFTTAIVEEDETDSSDLETRRYGTEKEKKMYA